MVSRSETICSLVTENRSPSLFFYVLFYSLLTFIQLKRLWDFPTSFGLSLVLNVCVSQRSLSFSSSFECAWMCIVFTKFTIHFLFASFCILFRILLKRKSCDKKNTYLLPSPFFILSYFASKLAKREKVAAAQSLGFSVHRLLVSSTSKI